MVGSDLGMKQSTCLEVPWQALIARQERDGNLRLAFFRRAVVMPPFISGMPWSRSPKSTEFDYKACAASSPFLAVKTRYPFCASSIFCPSARSGAVNTEDYWFLDHKVHSIFGLSVSGSRWCCSELVWAWPRRQASGDYVEPGCVV